MVNVTICELIADAAARFPDHVALQMYGEDGDFRLTYRQLLASTRNLSAALRRKGIKKGDRVAIWARLEPNWVIACLGILHCGGVVVPLDVEYGREEVASILEDTECNLVFTKKERIPLLQIIRSGGPRPLMLVVLDSTHADNGATGIEELLQDCDEDSAPPSNSPADVAMIFFTSGTTGKPKGVVIQHQSINNSVQGLQQYVGLSPTDRLVALLPGHHVLASVANIFVPLIAGASVTYLQSVNPTALLTIIQKEKITVFPAVPRIFYLLHQKIFDELGLKPLPLRLIFKILLRACYWIRRVTGMNPGKRLFARVHQAFGGHLRLLVSAASYFDPRVINDFYSLGFTVLQGYALTETFGGGTFTPLQDNAIGSVGQPLPGLKLKIIESDQAGVGEIAISGASVMQGYFGDPESTAQVLKDGWFYTGDLGHSDAQNNYYITGRKKEMIVLNSGKKVYPEEVETHYMQSPYIKEICLMGITDSSRYASSERLHAVIVPDFDCLRQQRLVNSKEIIRDEVERLSVTLPSYKRVLSYHIQTDPLPRTTTLKIRRWQVQQERALSATGNDSRIEAHSNTDGDDLLLAAKQSRRVTELIREEFHIPHDLNPDMNLELDLGFDSLQRIELITRIEQVLHIRLGGDAAGQFLTLRDLLKAVNLNPSNDEDAASLAASPAGNPWKQILSAPEPDDGAQRYILRSSQLTSWLSFGLLRLVFLSAKILFKLEVRGLENLPPGGPYLICVNHQSYLDGILVFSALPYRTLRHLFSVGHSPYFERGFKKLIAILTKIVPIDPDSNLVRAMQVSAAGLKANKILLIFPEGNRTYDGELQTFKKGAAILATELHVPVLPVAIEGSFDAWSKVSDRIRFLPIKITIGKPFYLEIPGASQDYEQDYTRGAEKMRNEVSKLMSRRSGSKGEIGEGHKPSARQAGL